MLEHLSDGVAAGLEVLSMPETAEAARDPFLRQAILVVVDGFEPTLARTLLESTISATLRQEETLCQMVATWAESVGAEEPPALLERRIRMLYVPGIEERGSYTKATLASVKKALNGRHLDELSLDEAASFLIEAGILTRLKGVEILASALPDAGHPLLAHAIELLEGHARPPGVPDPTQRNGLFHGP